MPDLATLPPQVTRRTFTGLTLAGTGALLGACEALDGSGSPGASGSDTPTTSSPTIDAPDVDADLAAALALSLATTAAFATATADAVAALARPARRLATLHTAHAAQLGRTDPAPPPSAVAEDRTAARRALLATEADLQEELVTGALQAEGGALAQVLASMAAAVAQQRAVLA